MMNFILKLCIQNNLPNTLKCKNGSFSLYTILEFEYKKRENEKQIHQFLEPNRALHALMLVARMTGRIRGYLIKKKFKFRGIFWSFISFQGYFNNFEGKNQ